MTIKANIFFFFVLRKTFDVTHDERVKKSHLKFTDQEFSLIGDKREEDKVNKITCFDKSPPKPEH